MGYPQQTTQPQPQQYAPQPQQYGVPPIPQQHAYPPHQHAQQQQYAQHAQHAQQYSQLQPQLTPIQQPSSVPAPAPSQPTELCWECPSCTFKNPAKLAECEMCGGAQPESPSWVQSVVESTDAPTPSPSPLSSSISMGGGGSSDVDQFVALTGADASTASKYISENEDVRAAINAL